MKNELTVVTNPPPAVIESGFDMESMLTVISKAARDPSVDVEKAERLFALLERGMERKSEMDFNRAMKLAQSEMPAIVRDSLNPQTNSKYAKLENIQSVLAPVLLKYGLCISFGTDKSELPEHYGVTAIVSHDSGHKRNYRCDVPVDMLGLKGNANKTRTHGFGSSLSYGERYLMKLIFNIRLVGEDDDGNAGNKPKPKSPMCATPEYRKRMMARFEELGLTAKAHQFAIDKGLVMPDAALETWPLDDVPATKEQMETLIATIKRHQ